MTNKISIPVADGYSVLVLTKAQVDALSWLLDRDEVQDLISNRNNYYSALKPIIQRVQAKIDEQTGSANLV